MPGHLGKFNRPDPMRDWDWENPGSINLYQYVRNDPINASDPTGLERGMLQISYKADVETVKRYSTEQGKKENMMALGMGLSAATIGMAGAAGGTALAVAAVKEGAEAVTGIPLTNPIKALKKAPKAFAKTRSFF